MIICMLCFPLLLSQHFHFWLAKHWGEWPWCVACHQYGCSKSTQPGCVSLFCSKQSRFLAQHRLWQRRLFFFNTTMFYTWKRINNNSTSGNDSVVASDFVRSTKRWLYFKIQTKDWLLLQALIWIFNHVRALAWANGRGESVTSGSGTRPPGLADFEVLLRSVPNMFYTFICVIF